MAGKRKNTNKCTKHLINLCEEVKYVAQVKKAQIETRRIGTSSIEEAINEMIEEWGHYHKILPLSFDDNG